MPIPRPGDTEDEFISRCMKVTTSEGYPEDQAYAICKGKWEQKKFQEDMKEIELIVKDEMIDGIMGMSFVTMPAIEEELVYFNKHNNYTFSKTIDAEQGIVVSPALIPEKRIYRYDPFTNEEYQVYFTAETIRKLSQNFLIFGNHNFTTEQHEHPIQGVHLIYSWIVENQQDPLITKYGYKNIPNGTWAVSYKITNEDIKNKIKSGEIKGLSIEAWLSERLDNSIQMDYEDKINQIIKLLENI